jgi:tRNA (cmo5U34)-methyltransferase
MPHSGQSDDDRVVIVPADPIAYSLGQPPEPAFPESRWTFDARVTDQFDSMLARSIPQYDVMRRACFDLGTAYVQRGTDIVDLGASKGEAIAPFIDYFGAQNRFVLCEISEPMLAALRSRFRGWIENAARGPQLMEIAATDLRREFPRRLMPETSLVLSVLCLQFTPLEYRQQIMQRIYDRLMPGGALIFVEKVMGETARLDDLMVKTYLARKQNIGRYTTEEIERKRAALEGVLVPLTERWNLDLMRGAGFRQVDCFWRWMNFAAWVAVK